MMFCGTNNLLVISHPDDEVLFAYTALTAPNTKWHVFCCTNGDNQIRSKEFKIVMDEIGTTYEILDYPDLWGGGFPEDELSPQLETIINGYDAVLTHNLSGEYKHSQHQSLSAILYKTCNKPLYVFGVGMQPLTFKTLQAKMKLLKLYKSQYDLNGYDWRSNEDKENYLMKYVVSEGFVRVK